MQHDFTKLGKLIEKCRESNVSNIEITETLINVHFFGQNEPASDDGAVLTFPLKPVEPVDESTSDEEEEAKIQKRIDEEMLHLTDPVEWQRRELLKDDQDENTIAVGGDEEDGDFDV